MKAITAEVKPSFEVTGLLVVDLDFGVMRASKARYWNESVSAFFTGAWTLELAGMRSQILEEAFKFPLHCVHFFAHVDDDLDPGKVNPEVAREGENYFEAFEVFVGI